MKPFIYLFFLLLNACSSTGTAHVSPDLGTNDSPKSGAEISVQVESKAKPKPAVIEKNRSVENSAKASVKSSVKASAKVSVKNSQKVSVQAKSKPKLKPKSKPVVIEKDLWRYISNRLVLSAPDQKKLFWHIDWFKKNPDYLTRVTKRAQPYLYLVTKEVEKAGLPIEIALLPIVESAYYPFSYSHGTASGLWQFIPSTGKLYGLKENWWYDGRLDVAASTKAAINYLKNLKKLFKGDWLLAVAAYNSGPGRVQRAIRKNKKMGKKADFWHLDLPPETRGYVPRLLAVAELIKNPKKYGQTITPVDNFPQLQSITLKAQFNLAVIARWAGLGLDDIHALNPGFKRWATPNNPPYQLLLPIANVDQFEKNRDAQPNSQKVKWLRHRVKSGESLSYLAKKFKTTMVHIQSVNHLIGDRIKVGDYLIIPIAQQGENNGLLSKYGREKNKFNIKKIKIKVVHTVVSGDSLWKIAKQYNTQIKHLLEWNHLNRADLLMIGKKLVIWNEKTIKESALSKLTRVGIDINRKVSYRIRKGDNLSKIAKKFKVSVSDLRLWNQLDRKQYVQPGQKLRIVVNVINSKMK